METDGEEKKKLWQKWQFWVGIVVLLASMGAGWIASIGFYSLFPGSMPASLREKGTEDTQVIRSM